MLKITFDKNLNAEFENAESDVFFNNFLNGLAEKFLDENFNASLDQYNEKVKFAKTTGYNMFRICLYTQPVYE